jgi:two-component system OmpR family response regulator
LVADDEDHIRELMAILLRGAEFEVLTARDGQEALEVALARQPDVALLDIAMPKLSGTEVSAELRRSENGNRVRVILVSAYDPDESTPTEHFIRKPFTARDIVQAVEDCLA